MSSRVPFVIVLAAGTLCASALAASTSENPTRLVLQPSDLPSGATRTPLAGLKGATVSVPTVGRVRPYGVAYRFRKSGRVEAVGSVAFVFSSEAAAKTAFAKARSKNSSTRFTQFSAPRLGDQQWTAGLFHRSASAAVLVVRSDEVIWEVVVSDAPGLSRAAAVAEVIKYAHKQRARVD
jgi:hypothetical protein